MPSADIVSTATADQSLASQQQEQRHTGTSSDAPRKRLKRRPIACTECRRRKAKASTIEVYIEMFGQRTDLLENPGLLQCDRRTPCSECIKRGEESLCEGAYNAVDDISPFWQMDGSAIGVPAMPTIPTTLATMPFAPAAAGDLDRLVQRVKAIEARLQMYEDAATSVSPPISGMNSGSNSISMTGQTYSRMNEAGETNGDDGLEAAVISIETVALEYFGEPAALPSPGAFRCEDARNKDPIHLAFCNRTESLNDVQGVSEEYNAGRGTIWLAARPSRVSIATKLIQGGNMLHAIVQSLPRRDTCHKLLQAFFEYADDGWHYVHRPSFKLQCDQFLKLSTPTIVERLDPAWIAVFTSALALGARALHLRDPGSHDGIPLHVKLHAATQLALQQAEWTTRPQVRVIQALIGMICLLSHAGSLFFTDPEDRDLGGGNHSRVLLGIGISLARRLGLHNLDENANPSNRLYFADSSFPFNGPSSLHTELGRRLWWSLVTLDGKSCIGKDSERYINRGSHSTPLPSRTLDESLGPNIHANQVAKGSFSDADTILYQARLVEFLDCVPKTAQPSYSEIIALDNLWRSRFQELLGTDLGDTGWIATQPFLRTPMQANLMSALHARMLRLHRPYFLKGLRNSQYALSYKTSLQCAQAILAVLASPVVSQTNTYQWWAYQHAINALVVMVLADLYRKLGFGQYTGLDTGFEVAIAPARDLFRRGELSKNKAVSATGKQCRKLLDLLCSIDPCNVNGGESPDSLLVSALGQAARSLHELASANTITEPSKSGGDCKASQLPQLAEAQDKERPANSMDTMLLASNLVSPSDASTETLAALSQELLQYLGNEAWRPETLSTTMASISENSGTEFSNGYSAADALNAEYSWLFEP